MRELEKVLALSVLIGNSLVFAVVPTNLTEEQQKKLDQFVLDHVKVMRVKEPQPPPAFVKEFNDKYTELCRKRAEKEFADHGRWFHCVDHKEFRGNIRWDEVVTLRVYWQLIAGRGGLEKVPNYSAENRRKAVAFWQAWQKQDGSFYNRFTGRGNGPGCNGKYIPGLLKMLGGAPKYTTSGYGKAKIDTDAFLKGCAANRGNHQGAEAAVLLTYIHQGQTEYIPILERGMELFLGYMNPKTGMFHGGRTPSGSAWRGYGTTANHMKCLARLIGYMGTENMPCRHVRADALLANQAEFRRGPVSVKRNTAEMFLHCLMESPYRSEELLKALDGHSRVIVSGQPWRSHITGDYAAYVLMLFGPYLNWKGYDGRAPRTPFYQGAAHDWRVVIGPFGRCANVIKKQPEELLWHKEWRYRKHGLRGRNTMHEKRKVTDIVPASADGWQQSKDEKGRIVLTRKFALGKTKMDNPYLKIKWSGGDIEIFINGILVRKKLGSLADYGAVYIMPEVRRSLNSGENTMMIRTVSAAKGALNVSAGFIDWFGGVRH